MTAAPPAEIEAHEPHWISRQAFPIISILLYSTQAALAVAVFRDWVWLAVPLALIASHLMHGFLIGFHEASHGMLRKSRFLNDLDGVILGIFSLLSFTLYRAMHQKHHAHLATERDVELWPFVHPGCPRGARCAAAFLELNVGLFFTPFIFMRAFLSTESPIRSRRVRRRIWAEIALTAVLWAAILAAVHHFGVWKYFMWMLFGPAFLAGNLQSWRKYIEHVGMTGATVNSATRSIVADTWLGRLVSLTLLHEPFHGVHHQCAGVRHAELSRHVAKLAPNGPGDHAPYPSYSHAFRDLFRCLADPRVGAQWCADEKRASDAHG